MTTQAAGEFRRTSHERSDQQVSWQRTDQAFFASGACHILAWTCCAQFPDRSIKVWAMRFTNEPHAFHVYAKCGDWVFDHSGWNLEQDLLAANAAFEGRPFEHFEITDPLEVFCERHYSRLPDQYWSDPVPRAVEYLAQFNPPW